MCEAPVVRWPFGRIKVHEFHSILGAEAGEHSQQVVGGVRNSSPRPIDHARHCCPVHQNCIEVQIAVGDCRCELPHAGVLDGRVPAIEERARDLGRLMGAVNDSGCVAQAIQRCRRGDHVSRDD